MKSANHRNAMAALVCVVEEALDVLALERTGGYQGKYHVLQGVLSPIEGIGPDDLKDQTTDRAGGKRRNQRSDPCHESKHGR